MTKDKKDISTVLAAANVSLISILPELSKRRHISCALTSYSNKINRDAIYYDEVLEILDIIGYKMALISNACHVAFSQKDVPPSPSEKVNVCPRLYAYEQGSFISSEIAYKVGASAIASLEFSYVDALHVFESIGCHAIWYPKYFDIEVIPATEDRPATIPPSKRTVIYDGAGNVYKYRSKKEIAQEAIASVYPNFVATSSTGEKRSRGRPKTI